MTGAQYFAGSGNGWKQERRGELARIGSLNPDIISARDLAAMHTEEFTKFGAAWRAIGCRYRNLGPAMRHLQLLQRYGFSSAQIAKLVRGLDRTHDHSFRTLPDTKTRNRARRGGIGEWHGSRAEDMKGYAPEAIDKHVAQKGSIVHVKPLGGCDEDAAIPFLAKLLRLEKKMNV
ncbi:MAG: hypothetical protein ACREML_08535 [Vulcanimicrobiaceae bacterium]